MRSYVHTSGNQLAPPRGGANFPAPAWKLKLPAMRLALSTLIVVGPQVASDVIRDHAEEIRSIAVLEGCDHKDLAIPLR
jgi:hypothetical protein